MVYLFSNWDNLKENLKRRFVYLFLDYDGTLVPIAESPSKTVIPEEIKEIIRGLSKSPRCKIAVVSGRALEDVRRLLGLKEIVYVGNHGLEIEGPKLKFKSVVPLGFKKILKRIKYDLNKKLASIKGVLFEDKGYTLSLHYRLVNEKQVPLVKAAFHEAIITYLVGNKIKIKSGKKVFEIRPPIEWDKGKAVLWLLARQRFVLKSNNIFPIYIGDDITDEDAFNALKENGASVFVGEPKKSKARYYLKNSKEVIEFLKRALGLQEV